jgi:uncharacterized oligopeptide transporter (OPT) family protein
MGKGDELMKNLSGALYVLVWCAATVLVVTIAIAAAFMVYATLGFLVFFVMSKSYLFLGNTWFFITWITFLVALIGYNIFKCFRKRKRYD